MNQITINDYPCNQAITIGGIQNVYITRRSYFSNRYWQYGEASETGNFQYPIIIGPINQKVRLIKIPIVEDSAVFNQSVNKSISRLYSMTLDVELNTMSSINRNAIEQMVVCDDVLIVFQDFNGRYWLMGENYGCKANNTSTTDTFKGRNKNTITFTYTDRFPIREVNVSFIIYYLPEFQIFFALIDWTFFIATNWQDFQNLLWS